MRRMREHWRYYLLAVPAIAAAFGVPYLLGVRTPETRDPALSMKPSQFRGSSIAEPALEESRKPASRGAADSKGAEVASKPQKIDKPSKADATPSDEEIDRYAAMDDEESTAPRSGSTGARRPPGVEVPRQPGQSLAKADAPKGPGCASVEYRGDGPENTKITKQDWAKVMTHYHGVKGEFLAWLKRNAKDMPENVAGVLEDRIRSLRIQRPPTPEEPDLAWRGIGVWTEDARGEPLLRVGGGFVKLVLKDPARGRFELARLVAQAWAPCELERQKAVAVWAPLLQCLGVAETNACAPGTYSEGGWAVSTALAAVVADPGCVVPAFSEARTAACITQIPLRATTAAREPASIMKGALAQGGRR